MSTHSTPAPTGAIPLSQLAIGQTGFIQALHVKNPLQRQQLLETGVLLNVGIRVIQKLAHNMLFRANGRLIAMDLGTAANIWIEPA